MEEREILKSEFLARIAKKGSKFCKTSALRRKVGETVGETSDVEKLPRARPCPKAANQRDPAEPGFRRRTLQFSEYN